MTLKDVFDDDDRALDWVEDVPMTIHEATPA